MLLAAPELWVLVMACVILIVDLFLKEERRGIIHGLAMITLIFAAIITIRGAYAPGSDSALAFNDSFIRDPMGDVLKLFSFFVLAIVYIYAKFCLRQFRMYRANFNTLSLYALLGVLAALIGVLFTRLLYAGGDFFDSRRRLPEWSKPAIGGALLGALALVYPLIRLTQPITYSRVPHVFGVGYGANLKLAEDTIRRTIMADTRSKTDPESFIQVNNLGDFSVDFE